MKSCMSNISKERKGEILIIAQALIASLFPIITKVSIRNLNPLSSLLWSTIFALIFFTGIIFWRNSWSKFLNREALPSLIGAGVILGVFFPLLQFIGLKYTSAGNAGVILTMEVFFTFLFFNFWKKDYLSRKHL